MVEKLNNQSRSRFHSILVNYLPPALVILFAFAIWIICYPGFMSADSLVQYSQAVSGIYTDMHPPIMSVILHYVLKAGGNIGLVTLLQSLLGCMGVYLLSKTIFRLHMPFLKNKKFHALSVLIILLSPLTPLTFYLMTFWKDSWTAIGFIWICYLTLAISFQEKTNRAYYLLYILNLFTMILVLLVRHNTIILLPLFNIILFSLPLFKMDTHKRGLYRIIPPLMLILLFSSVSYGMNKFYKLNKTNPANEVIALESVGVLLDDTTYKMGLPYLYSHLTPKYREAFRPGRAAMWEGEVRVLDSSFDLNNPQLSVQYFNLLRQSPMALLKVKWNAFALMLKPWTSDYYFHSKLDKNDYGLALNSQCAKARDWLIRNTASIHDSIISRYFFGGHLLWLLLNVAIIYFLLKRRVKNNKALVCLALIPLLYYFSYLIAATDNDYRFMYPSTLAMQLVTVVLLTIFVRNRFFLKTK